jgi:hypothetical protein
MGVTGVVCRHCKLDEELRAWEARLFQLKTRALQGGQRVRARARARARVCVCGCGGLCVAGCVQGAVCDSKVIWLHCGSNSRARVCLRLQVDADEAARTAAAARQRAGMGGLHEGATEEQLLLQQQQQQQALALAAGAGVAVGGPTSGAGARHAGTAVARTEVQRAPSEAEQVLKLLQQQLGKQARLRCDRVRGPWSSLVCC